MPNDRETCRSAGVFHCVRPAHAMARPTMRTILVYYLEQTSVQSLAVVIPYVGYVIAWFARSLALIEWTFYGMVVTVAAILVASVRHRVAGNREKARLSLNVFCIMFLLTFVTVLVLSPLSFRTDLSSP